MDFYDPSAAENEDEEDTFGKEVYNLRHCCRQLPNACRSIRHDQARTSLQGYEQLREYIIFLVDASPSMQQTAEGELPKVAPVLAQFVLTLGPCIQRFDVACTSCRSMRARRGCRSPS